MCGCHHRGAGGGGGGGAHSAFPAQSRPLPPGITGGITGTLTTTTPGAPPLSKGAEVLPFVIAVGFMCAFSEALALLAIDANTVPTLKDVLLAPGMEDHVRAATVWALSQVGRHSPTHARALADSDVYRHILHTHTAPGASEDLREKSRRCLLATVPQCDHLLALQPLLTDAPTHVLHAVLARVAAVTNADKAQRKAFLGSGGLKTTLALEVAGDADASDHVTDIAAAYPPEVVAYCRPDYMATLTARV